MKVMPIRYVKDVAASQRFYAALGLDPDVSSRSGNWSELAGAGGILALHSIRQADAAGDGGLELCFVTDEPLESLATRLDTAAIEHDGIVDENFGRLLRVTDPDGMVIQINEHDAELYS